MLSSESIPRWLVYSLVSSLLCVVGGLCVPLISFCFRGKKDLNTKLVNYGLSLSAGSMITTALYKMLPSDKKKSSNPYSIFGGLMLGMFLSLVLNYVVHACASESLVHCAHDAGAEDEEGSHSHHSHHDGHEHEHTHATEPETVPPETSNRVEEYAPPTGTELLRPQSMRKKSSLFDMLSTGKAGQLGDCLDLTSCPPMTNREGFSCVPSGIKVNEAGSSSSSTGSMNERSSQNGISDPVGVACLENEIGYDLENLALYRKNFHSNRKLSLSTALDHISIHSSLAHHEYGSINDSDHAEDLELELPSHHHHHFETPFSKLLSIGLQTCVVITLHKFPEGFIIFYTNQSSDVSKALGFSIFLSLTVHNFVEGFSMTLPFYAAFENKALALLITTLLGGCSQPLGALIGYLIFKDKDNGGGENQPHMDTYLSATAGFLLVIGLQMFQTAVGFSQSHHHHQGEGGEELKENHSSGTTCLKWCCVGVLLIISSGMLRSS